MIFNYSTNEFILTVKQQKDKSLKIDLIHGWKIIPIIEQRKIDNFIEFIPYISFSYFKSCLKNPILGLTY
jgi:hypothetical protein